MTIELPNIEIALSGQSEIISNEAQFVLFVGQMTSAGSAMSGVLVENIDNDNSENALFGEDSMIAGMIRNARKYNTVTRFDAIPLADHASSVAATGSFAISGTATAVGSLYFITGSNYDHRYQVDVNIGDSATDIGDALEALINADAKCPVNSANVTGTVTLTAINKGEEADKIGLFSSGSAAGIAVALTAMSGGSDNPTLTDIFDVCGDIRYQTIVYPSTYTPSHVSTFLENRFNNEGKPLDGVVIRTLVDDAATLVSIGEGHNDESMVIIGNNEISLGHHEGGAIREIGNAISSQFAAIRSLRLTEDANIANYVVSPTGARDDFGGAAISSLPYFNTPFEYLGVINVANEFTKTEQAQLLTAGVMILGNNPSRNGIISGEAVTTYKTDAASNPDDTFKYLNYVDTSVACREFFYNNLREECAQSRLTEGNILPNRSMNNAKTIGAKLDNLYNILSGVDYVLTQSGRTALRYFKDHRSIELVMSEGKVIVTMRLPIVVQLRSLIISMKVGFSINS